MFDIASTELLMCVIVAILVIGPKDLPRAMRFVGNWIGKARGVMRQVKTGMDGIIRETELEDMEKKWALENERIMKEHPDEGAMQPLDVPFSDDGMSDDASEAKVTDQPEEIPNKTDKNASET